MYMYILATAALDILLLDVLPEIPPPSFIPAFSGRVKGQVVNLFTTQRYDSSPYRTPHTIDTLFFSLRVI